ncbi:MAG: hypothetical protein FJW32_11220 [Acidobacteria bacterium]|nr:hypothetical protein [Acidobacteriota bacterium]
MSRPAVRAARSSPADTMAAIEAFLAAAQSPVLQEPGQAPIALAVGSYSFEVRAASVQVSAWNNEAQLHRKIGGVVEARRGRLTLTVEKFGGKTGTIVLYDAARPQSETLQKQASRHVLREAMRVYISKSFPGWKLTDLSADLDLEHSLSANYPRALLRRGAAGIAVIGAGESHPSRVLTHGLIWLDYLRRREPSAAIETLAIFVPPEALTVTALRMRYLTNSTFRLFTYSRDGALREEDPADWGNLNTDLLPAAQAERRSSMIGEEALLELVIREQLENFDATLVRQPVYAQVTSIAGVDHAIADLLAVDPAGRLAVIEIKTSEDIHLPLQALDYWMRIAHHAMQGDFAAKGYFPGVELRTDAPRLILTAPALGFHPTTETILRFFSSNISVERIGIGLEWRHKLRVLFRYRGAERPGE